jgi:hypothetical protein
MFYRKKKVNRRGPRLILLPQGRQSAKLFLQSSEWGLPHPFPRRRLCSVYPPFGYGRAHLLAGEGLGESQFGRGDIHCSTLDIYVLRDFRSIPDPLPFSLQTTFNPILHTAWLDNHALTLKSNSAKYYFQEKSRFLHTFLKFCCESRKI